MAGRRGTMPILSKVAAYWQDNAAGVFPRIAALAADWGLYAPVCFRCHWLPPMPDTLDDEGYEQWLAWGYARGWLQRAHLVDHWLGGPNDPENLVPLCVLCHHAMPQVNAERQVALDYINDFDPESANEYWQQVTDYLFDGPKYRACPGLRALIRVRLRVDETLQRLMAQELQAA